jgi:hypothetical protein
VSVFIKCWTNDLRKWNKEDKRGHCVCLGVMNIAFKRPSTEIKGQHGAPSKVDLELYLMLSKTLFEGTNSRCIWGKYARNACAPATLSGTYCRIAEWHHDGRLPSGWTSSLSQSHQTVAAMTSRCGTCLTRSRTEQAAPRENTCRRAYIQDVLQGAVKVLYVYSCGSSIRDFQRTIFR